MKSQYLAFHAQCKETAVGHKDIMSDLKELLNFRENLQDQIGSMSRCFLNE